MLRHQRLLLVLVLASLWGACRREPAIVIRFDTRDLAGAPPPGDALHPMPDAAVASVGDRTILAKKEDAPEAKKDAKPAARCKTDADCVIVPDGCCDCANGGKQRAAAKSEEAALRAAQREACKDVMCTMMISTDPTCGKRAACVEGACVLREARPDEVRKLGPR